MDHRDIAREMNLFMFSPLAPGMPVWLSNGQTIYLLLQDRIRRLNLEYGYEEVHTPMMWKSELYRTSGHLDHYSENMYRIESEDEMVLKPMNCPGHMVIFGSQTRSYRDLPIRLADHGVLHRNEVSGAVGGLTRCRAFCQDDAHCFVRPDQIDNEIADIIAMTKRVYQMLGMSIRAVFSSRPDKFLGDENQWDKAESQLKFALENSDMVYEVALGEGAFYGPKIDFMVKDSAGREWQTATAQLDFQLPHRFNLHYASENNNQELPVVVHRAIYGSFERFIGVLIEHFQGIFPFWLAPVQFMVLPIADRHNETAKVVAKRISSAGMRVQVDDSAGSTLSKKIAVSQNMRIPFYVIIGDREMENETVTVRDRKGKNETMEITGFIEKFSSESRCQF